MLQTNQVKCLFKSRNILLLCFSFLIVTWMRPTASGFKVSRRLTLALIYSKKLDRLHFPIFLW